MSIVSLQNVTKVFPGAETPSVDDVSLEIKEGEFLCLLGPSGCGKSTTLRMIAGLEPLTSGAISIGGKVVDDVAASRRVPAERRNLSLVFQSYALWPHMSVRENVEFGPRCQGLSRTETKQIVDESLEKLAITQYAQRYPAELSGGQQQRVAIARTLASRTNVMLLDEPLSNLDARLRLEMRSEFQRIHRETGSTMVFVTHDQWEAMTLATRIVVMNEGKIQQEGTPMEIYGRPANTFVAQFMGSPPINMIDAETAHGALGRWLQTRGWQAHTAGFRPEDLRFVPVAAPGSAGTTGATDGNGQNRGTDASTRSTTAANASAGAAGVPADALRFEVEISGVLPTGGSWIIEAKEGGTTFFGTATRRPALEYGQRAIAWVEPEAIHLFNAAGNRIEPGQRTGR